MTDEPKQFSDRKAAELSDDALKAYLLGQLKEAERSVIDQRLLTDDDLAERVRLAESQLVDEYAAGEVADANVEAFRANFLKTDLRREQLLVASALRDYAAGQSGAAVIKARPPEKRSWRETLADFFVVQPGPAWAAAGSFALLVLVLGGAWYLSRQARQPEVPIAKQSPINTALPEITTASPEVAQASATPLVKATPSEPPVAVASFVLLPGALRGPGEMTRVAVPRGERDVLRLSLVLENPGPGIYQAELATAEGQTLTVRKQLKPYQNGQTKVTFNVPARLVQDGDYQVKLSRLHDGQLESVGRYYFRAHPE